MNNVAHLQKRTVKDAIILGSRELERSDSGRLDAEILLAYILGLSRTQLYCAFKDQLKSQDAYDYQQVIKKRRLGIPVPYITGYAEFWSMKLKITEDVLVPRPETELLVEVALDHIKKTADFITVDLGTGSGAIAAAIASEHPDIYLVAADQSEAALSLAQSNFTTLNLKNIRCVASNWMSAFRNLKASLIVANPPYVSVNDSNLVDQAVLFEPTDSVFADSNGLSELEKIIRTSWDSLKNNGHLIVEHGHLQGTIVRNYFAQIGFTHINTFKDINRHDRVTMGKTTD